jgi:serine protease inhibitor
MDKAKDAINKWIEETNTLLIAGMIKKNNPEIKADVQEVAVIIKEINKIANKTNG